MKTEVKENKIIIINCSNKKEIYISIQKKNLANFQVIKVTTDSVYITFLIS